MNPADQKPCETCGSPVRLRADKAPRRLGEAVAETIHVRVCTNRDCDTNHPGRRSLGQVV